MKLSKVLNDIATAIATDAAIETFCQTNFGKSVSVYIHIDKKNPPSVSKSPWVGLAIQGYRNPTQTNGKTMEFDLESYICCNEDGETVVGKITTLDGFSVIEDFSDLVLNSIETILQTSATQLDLTINSEGQTSLIITDFPGWMAARVFTASKRI